MAGRFYEADARRLADAVDGYVAAARAGSSNGGPPDLRAVVVPHAGHIYSGPTAGFGFAAVADEGRSHPVRCVVMLGPAHYVPVAGIGLSTAPAWRTPLGEVPLDPDLTEDLLGGIPQAHPADRAHTPEHSLEVQVPFLQRVLDPGFALCPLLVGMDIPDAVGTVVSRAASIPGVLVLISTDLSHYLDQRAARGRDDRTITAVLARDPDGIGERDACGRLPLRGLLTAARDLGWQVRLLDARTSGDTAGGPDRVVGYAAFTVTGAAAAGSLTATRSAESPRSQEPRRDASLAGPAEGSTAVSTSELRARSAWAPSAASAGEPRVERAGRHGAEPGGTSVAAPAGRGRGRVVSTGSTRRSTGSTDGLGSASRDEDAPSGLSAAEQRELLAVARGTIEQALATRRRPRFDGSTVSARLQRPGAAFVTIRSGSGELMGCIGSLAPARELAADVVGHAFDAAFRDPRFPPLTPDRAADIRVAISVLTPARPFPATDYDDLVERMPRGSGLTVLAPGHRGTLLPVVWGELPGAASFVGALWRKAGLAHRVWPDRIRLEVYSAQEFQDGPDILPP